MAVKWSRLVWALSLVMVRAPSVLAQNELPVLRTNAEAITVIDGDHVRTKHWFVMPDRDPDIYYVEIPMKSHTVTFKSDIDSISFDVTYGARHDFIVLFNQTAYPTQVRAEFRQPQPYVRTTPVSAGAGDAIPFDMGDNDKIYIVGRLNRGPELVFQFDLGAGGGVIKKDSVPVANMQFDGTATLHNSDGSNVVPSSSRNRLEVGNLRWDGLPFVVGDNMSYREDGLLGNFLFQGKVVEINYDRQEMVIRDTLPEIDATYSRHAIILENGIPFVQGTLSIAGDTRQGWFMFDTGAYTSSFHSDRADALSKLLIELQKMVWSGRTPVGPRLTIGDHAFANFNYRRRDGPAKEDRLGLLGNDLLKRFNVILDNQDGYIYLQPNRLTNARYRNTEQTLARTVVVAGSVGVCAGAWLLYGRRVRRRMFPADQ